MYLFSLIGFPLRAVLTFLLIIIIAFDVVSVETFQSIIFWSSIPLALYSFLRYITLTPSVMEYILREGRFRWVLLGIWIDMFLLILMSVFDANIQALIYGAVILSVAVKCLYVPPAKNNA